MQTHRISPQEYERTGRKLGLNGFHRAVATQGADEAFWLAGLIERAANDSGRFIKSLWKRLDDLLAGREAGVPQTR